MSPRTTTPVLLVVDDDVDTAALVAALLERDGFVTRQAYSGREALEIIAREPIALLLLDVMMPEMDGFAVCRALRNDGRRLPIILLTGRDDMTTRQASMHEGVSEFLTKPVDVHELRARVRAQLHIVALTTQMEELEENLRAATRQTDPADRS